MLLFISGIEIGFVIVIAVMLFGADKIPEIARGLGKGIRQVKDATNDVKREINKSAKENGIDTDFVKDINKDITELKDTVNKNFDDLTGPIKRKR